MILSIGTVINSSKRGLGMKIHRVEKGESIRSIAASYELSPIKLAENNGIAERERLIEGEELLVLTPTRTATAKRGDTPEDIARRYSVRVEDIYAYNPELSIQRGTYAGQPLVIRYDGGRYGMGIGNGYYYQGCSEDSLITAMPYMSYLTVASGVYDGETVSVIFDDTRIIELGRAAGKIPIFRLYLEKGICQVKLQSVFEAAMMMAKSRGYGGVTLAGEIDEEAARDGIINARRSFLECEMKLFIEKDVTESSNLADYVDGAILTYDKCHMELIPSFEEGEAEVFGEYAKEHESLRSFVDISSFLYSDGRFYDEDEIMRRARRTESSIGRIAGGDCLVLSVGKRGRERGYIFESMENTRKKLEMVSELGYYGISFDIKRTPIHKLLMFRTMFSAAISLI